MPLLKSKKKIMEDLKAANVEFSPDTSYEDLRNMAALQGLSETENKQVETPVVQEVVKPVIQESPKPVVYKEVTNGVSTTNDHERRITDLENAVASLKDAVSKA